MITGLIPNQIYINKLFAMSMISLMATACLLYTSIYSYYVEAVIADVTEDLMEQKGISESAARQLLYNGGYLSLIHI